MSAVNTYPVNLSVDYPDRPLDWLTSLFRIFTVIPIGIILGLLSGGGSGPAAGAGGLLTAPTLLMLVFRQAVHLVLPYSDARVELNRWLPLVKWLLAIPHYIVLAVLGLASVARRRSFESAQRRAVANLVHGDSPHLVVAAGTVRQPSIGAVETLRAVIANENPEHGFEEALAPHAGSRFGHQ
jgi:hypothetical protein